MKRITALILLSAFVFLVPLVCKRLTHGFRIAKLSYRVDFDPKWDLKPESQEKMQLVLRVLEQPLTYLGRGAQAFVFESADHAYVVKLFRTAPSMHPIRRYLRKYLVDKPDKIDRAVKLDAFFSACKLAYENAPDLTGLVFLHLNPIEFTLPFATFRDAVGRSYRLDMNQYRFCIQYRGNTVTQAFRTADRETGKKLIDSFAMLLKVRIDRQIRNMDRKVVSNFGFLKNNAIEWDFGNFRFDSNLQTNEARQEEALRFIIPLRRQIAKDAPDNLMYFDQKVEEIFF